MLHPCKKVDGVEYCNRDGAGYTPSETCKVFRREGAFIFLEQQGKLLMVKPVDGRSYWEIPGGGVDEGETFQQAAIREFGEETGFDLISANLEPVFEQRIYLYHRKEDFYWNYDQNYFKASGDFSDLVFEGIKEAPEEGHIQWVNRDELQNVKIKHTVIPALKAAGYLL